MKLSWWSIAGPVVTGAVFLLSCSSSDSDKTLPADCRAIEATHYDAERACIETVTLDNVCFELKAGSTAQSGEDVCFASPAGDAYTAFKDFNECLAGPGWVTDGLGEGHGWSVYGTASAGLCARDYSETQANGESVEHQCGAPAASIAPDCD
jgi:hypothetical protein